MKKSKHNKSKQTLQKPCKLSKHQQYTCYSCLFFFVSHGMWLPHPGATGPVDVYGVHGGKASASLGRQCFRDPSDCIPGAER